MLTLIGLGLHNEKDLTLKGIEQAKTADKAYIEFYTSKWHGSIKNLEKLIGKKIIILKRQDLEEKSEKILEEAKNKKVILFVLGDPLIATTHTSLILDAKKRGIETKIMHNASIYSAVGETGLQIYKFSTTATIPFSEKTSGELPTSLYDKIKQNQKRGLHTLLLLDIDSEKNKYMTPNQGMRILLNIEVIADDTDIVVFARAGSEKPLIMYGKIKDIIKKDFGQPPFVIIIPGKLHFTEKEYLEYYQVK